MHHKNSLYPHLAVWITVPVVEIYLSLNSLVRHDLWQYFVEIFVFLALGLIQWKFAKPLWLKSLLWPSIIILLLGLSKNGPLGSKIWMFFYLTGAVLIVVKLVKDCQSWLQPTPIFAALISIISILYTRYMDLSPVTQELQAITHDNTANTVDRLIEDLRINFGIHKDEYVDETPIIIISVDTLRADYAQSMTSWKRLAERGAWWESAMSSSSWTLPALGSLMTGALPGTHGAGCYSEQCQGLNPDIQTIAQTLKQHGYQNVALVSNA